MLIIQVYGYDVQAKDKEHYKVVNLFKFCKCIEIL